MKLQLLTFVILLVTGGCTPFARIVLGLKQPELQTSNDIQQWAGKPAVGIHDHLYELDTAYYNWVQVFFKHSAFSRKIFSQPLLVLSFKDNRLVSVNNNCAFPGAPNIQWNTFGNFNTFPPVSSYHDSLFNTISLAQFATFLKPISVRQQQDWKSGEKLFVVYSKAYNRQSKKLIQLIRKQYAAEQAHIYFVNNDNVIYNQIGNEFE